MITRSGFCPEALSFSSKSASSVSLVVIANAPTSSISLIACCCGKISLPFGAALSIGITRTTSCPGSIISPTSLSPFPSEGIRCPILSFSSSIPVFSVALTYITFPAPSSLTGTSPSRSDLFFAMINGIDFSSNILSSSSSVTSSCLVASVTRIAISVLFSICLVRLTRSSPSLPESSNPGVSVIRTGPKGRSSIAFCTGSVVVPKVSETTASC